MKLYNYWRSTTSVRVRIVLALKGVSYDYVPIALTRGEQAGADYMALNPAKGVPALVLDDGRVLTQSMAIIRYLEATYPEPPVLPADPYLRARVEAASEVIAVDIHPVNNLKILGYLKGTLGHSQDEAVAWMQHWMTEGFTAFQTMIEDDTPFAFGDTLGLADICLVGQMVNARRWGLDLAPFGRLVEIDARARELDAVRQGLPEAQPDAD
ncbi:maleylacetoacetate isomerase [Mesobacterium pallidum]|uniref:maleylacetoacetate isomerase n=1 Tax=Mesobacterium pallidum TaxID=2872037 RepID=UPI001EE1B621